MTTQEIAEQLVLRLRFLSDRQLEDVLNNLPNTVQSETVNIAIRTICYDEGVGEEFVCGDGDRPRKPPTS
jgi:hypothetical protein